MKWLDRVLNIVLLILIPLWLLGQFFAPEKPQTLEEAARQSFEKETSLLEQAIAEKDTPTGLLIFTTWCPYCKRLFPELVTLAKQEKSAKFIAVAMDKDEAALTNYLAAQPEKPPFPVHFYGDKKQELFDFVHAHNLSYNGGIPYLAFFVDGTPVAELSGYQTPEKLQTLLKDVDAHQQKITKENQPDEQSHLP